MHLDRRTTSNLLCGVIPFTANLGIGRGRHQTPSPWLCLKNLPAKQAFHFVLSEYSVTESQIQYSK